MLARIWRLLVWLFAPKSEMAFEGYHALYRDKELKTQWDTLKNRHIWGTCHYIDYEDHPVAHIPMVIYVGKFETFESMIDQFRLIEDTNDFGCERWIPEDLSTIIWERLWVKLHITKSFFTRQNGKDSK